MICGIESLVGLLMVSWTAAFTYLEMRRYWRIHGEIYKARPEVKGVVHNHAAAVIPFGTSTVALRPRYHMAGFIGRGVPIFDIRNVVGDTDMLVKTPELGAALARTIGDKPAALMRGHGAVVVGDSLPQAVGRNYYLQMGAKLQAQANGEIAEERGACG